MTNPIRSYSVTVTWTPRQAIEAEYALQRMAVSQGSARLFSAAHRITCGLFDAGWECENAGTEDEPRWTWLRKPEPAA